MAIAPAIIIEDSDVEVETFDVDFEWKEEPRSVPVPLPIPPPTYKCLINIVIKASWPTGEFVSCTVTSSLRPTALFREQDGVGDFNRKRKTNVKVKELLGSSTDVKLRNGERVKFTLEIVTQTSQGHPKLMEGPGGVGVSNRVRRTYTEEFTIDIDAPPAFQHPGVDVDPLPHGENRRED